MHHRWEVLPQHYDLLVELENPINLIISVAAGLSTKPQSRPWFSLKFIKPSKTSKWYIQISVTQCRIILFLFCVFEANSLCALTIAVIVAFIHSWQLALLLLACVRFLSEANLIQMRAAVGHCFEGQVMLQQSGKVLITWQHRAVRAETPGRNDSVHI